METAWLCKLIEMQLKSALYLAVKTIARCLKYSKSESDVYVAYSSPLNAWLYELIDKIVPEVSLFYQ